MNPMLRQFVHVHWKNARWPLVPFIAAGFALPFGAMQWAAAAADAAGYSPALDALAAMQIWTFVFPALAALLGATMALTAWSWDHRAGHVYALSLPVSRERYVTLKLVAGALLLLVPIAAAWIGAVLGALTIDVPDGLRAYPHAFAFRLLLGALICYAAVYALAAGTMKTAVYVITGFLLFLIFGSIVVGFVEQLTGRDDLWTPIQIMHAALSEWPGPFHVFGGNWMLIDV